MPPVTCDDTEPTSNTHNTKALDTVLVDDITKSSKPSHSWKRKKPFKYQTKRKGGSISSTSSDSKQGPNNVFVVSSDIFELCKVSGVNIQSYSTHMNGMANGHGEKAHEKAFEHEFEDLADAVGANSDVLYWGKN